MNNEQKSNEQISVFVIRRPIRITSSKLRKAYKRKTYLKLILDKETQQNGNILKRK